MFTKVSDWTDVLFPIYYEKGLDTIISRSLVICTRCTNIIPKREYVDELFDPLCPDCFQGCLICKSELEEYLCENCSNPTCGCFSTYGNCGRLLILCENCEVAQPTSEDETDHTADDQDALLGDYDYNMYNDETGDEEDEIEDETNYEYATDLDDDI